MFVTVWLNEVRACTHMVLSPQPPSLWLIEITKIQNRIQCMSQPIRSKSNDLMSGWVPYLMQDILHPLSL